MEWDHPALMAAYRGVISDTTTMTYTVDHLYNWFDAVPDAGRPARCESDPQVPCDDHGHGTHTVGTMVGDATADGKTILGMAPGAQWIGCRNMDHGTGTPASYAACFEFFLAPYPQDGDPMTDGKPELGPNIINNSWACPPSEGCDV
ncbi:MAG: S8 family serine peptidase, partial [Caldilineaceae bacterium]|nr:S8 family serine peptidase [Caldilineaceae bacterium]